MSEPKWNNDLFSAPLLEPVWVVIQAYGISTVDVAIKSLVPKKSGVVTEWEFPLGSHAASAQVTAWNRMKYPLLPKELRTP